MCALLLVPYDIALQTLARHLNKRRRRSRCISNVISAVTLVLFVLAGQPNISSNDQCLQTLLHRTGTQCLNISRYCCVLTVFLLLLFIFCISCSVCCHVLVAMQKMLYVLQYWNRIRYDFVVYYAAILVPYRCDVILVITRYSSVRQRILWYYHGTFLLVNAVGMYEK